MATLENIIQWNCNGCKTHYGELKIILAEKSPFCICLQESHFRPGEPFNLRGYNSFRKDIYVLTESSIIRDQVIFGFRDLHVKEVLLRDGNITLEKVSEYCRAVEVSKQQIEEFQREASVNINVVKRKSVKRDVIDDCNFCGYSHRIRNCPAFEFSKNKNNIFEIQEDESEPDDHDCMEDPNEHNSIDLYVSEVRKLQIERQQVWYEYINGLKIKIKVDSGAEVNCLPLKIFSKLQDVNIQPTNIMILGFGNNSSKIEPLGLSPSQLLNNRILRDKLPVHSGLLKQEGVNAEKVRRKLIKNQHVQKCYYDKKGVKNLPKVKEGDKIVIRKDGIWEPGTVIGKHQSPRSYIVEDDSGKILRRNKKLLKTSSSDFSEPSDESSEGSGRSEGRVSRTIRKPVRFDDYILS
ncbi:hypothetical protein JTB14_005305 [Gonioctena quinquepunctata]|nr:hypothetical protein JTB14_005305 [Gonioctena quinquepunctata]